MPTTITGFATPYIGCTLTYNLVSPDNAAPVTSNYTTLTVTPGIYLANFELIKVIQVLFSAVNSAYGYSVATNTIISFQGDETIVTHQFIVYNCFFTGATMGNFTGYLTRIVLFTYPILTKLVILAPIV